MTVNSGSERGFVDTISIRLTVDSTHLLGKHDGGGSKRSAAHAGNSEQLGKATKIVGSVNNLGFLHKLDMDIVELAGSLERTVTETEERAVGIRITVLFHQPPRRLCKGM